MNQRKRIISMALTLIVLLSVMAIAVSAAQQYSAFSIYYYEDYAASDTLSGTTAEATCWNWAASTDLTMTLRKNGAWYRDYEVSPGEEVSVTISDNSTTQYKLVLTTDYSQTRADALLVVS